MARKAWPEAVRSYDAAGRPADATVGSEEARRTWFALLHRVLGGGEVIRVRDGYFDQPALLVPEDHYRELERAAAEGDCAGGRSPGVRRAGRPDSPAAARPTGHRAGPVLPGFPGERPP